ncbi:LysM peptidoglycan-binding domain-containing protein [Rothia uropygialis]|uniref:LysM peptidoglycan-binding domain-containing protein n=1 Tax=Kocuria sp. 36 TaxID=1415402 RepID=UPI00101D0088|nr:hypothetical protein [Kocuria sp. 36]
MTKRSHARPRPGQSHLGKTSPRPATLRLAAGLGAVAVPLLLSIYMVLRLGVGELALGALSGTGGTKPSADELIMGLCATGALIMSLWWCVEGTSVLIAIAAGSSSAQRGRNNRRNNPILRRVLGLVLGTHIIIGSAPSLATPGSISGGPAALGTTHPDSLSAQVSPLFGGYAGRPTASEPQPDQRTPSDLATQTTGKPSPYFPSMSEPRALAAGSNDSSSVEYREWVVHRGESLWSIAGHLAGPGATDEDILRTMHAVESENRSALRGRPHLIHAGTVLAVPHRFSS